MSETCPPFELDLSTAHQWLDFIHDRIGDDQLYKFSSSVPKPRKTRQEYNSYLDSLYNVGYGKLPNITEKPTNSHLLYDFHAEEGGKLSPVGRIWINQHQRTSAENPSTSTSHVKAEVLNESDLSQLFELVREKLSFDLKFRIISMIPSTSRIVTKHSNQQWRELFPDDFSVACEVKDSSFVTFHKYRIISKAFNNRMQKKLMELDSLNLAKVYEMGQTPNVAKNLVKTAYILSFINSKRKFVLGKTIDTENINIYQDFDRICSCLQYCCAEMNNLVTHYVTGGTLYFNSSIAFLSADKPDLDLEDKDEEDAQPQQIVQNEDTEEFGGLFVEPEYVPKDPTEDDLVKTIDVWDNNRFEKHQFENLVLSSDKENIKQDYKKIAIRNKSFDFNDIPHGDFYLELANNSFEKITFSQLGSIFPNGKLPEIAPLSKPLSVNAKDKYYSILIRRKLKQVLPEMFSSIYDDNITLFKSLTICSEGNPFNNLILHLILENGKEIPQDLDENLLQGKNFKQNGIEEITFVNFSQHSIFECIENSKIIRGVNFSLLNNLGLFSKKKVEFREPIKNLVISSFENSVQKVNLHFHSDSYGISDEIDLICTHFPNVKEIRASLQTSLHYTPMNIFQNTTFDMEFKEIRELLSYNLEKIVVKTISCPIKTITEDTSIDAETIDISPLFETTVLEDGCLQVCISTIKHFEYQDIESLEKELEINLCRYPKFVIDLFQFKPGLEEKIELIDYFLERGFPESYFIFAFDYYTEDIRALKEYLIYRRKLSNNPILRNELSYGISTTFESIICDMFLGLDLVSNPQYFEKASFAAIALKCGRIHVPISSHYLLFTKLFVAKLFYENADIDLFMYFLEEHLKLTATKEMIEEAERWSCDVVQTDFSQERTTRTLQLFFKYITKPKHHTNFHSQKAVFNADRMAAYLALFVCSKQFRLLEACFTLGDHCFSNFNQLFTSPFSTNNVKSKLIRINNMAAVIEESPGKMFEYETKINRQKELLKILYHQNITDLETKINSSVLDENCVKDKLMFESTNVFNLMCCCSDTEIFILYAIEIMTPEQLMYQDNMGNTCLHILSEQAVTYLEFFEKIIEKQPAVVNLLNNDLNTALHLIAYMPFPSLFTIGKLLVEKYGANTDLINCYGLTAYEIAMLTILESKSLNDDKHYDLSWLLPTSGKTKKDIFHKMILDKQSN